jgi:hypothetical protein
MNEGRVARDRNGRPVLAGTRVRVLEICAYLKDKVPADEWLELQEMVGEVFAVLKIDESGLAWVEKWWYPDGEGSFCHSLGLDSQEMEVAEVEPMG